MSSSNSMSWFPHQPTGPLPPGLLWVSCPKECNSHGMRGWYMCTQVDPAWTEVLHSMWYCCCCKIDSCMYQIDLGLDEESKMKIFNEDSYTYNKLLVIIQSKNNKRRIAEINRKDQNFAKWTSLKRVHQVLWWKGSACLHHGLLLKCTPPPQAHTHIP